MIFSSMFDEVMNNIVHFSYGFGHQVQMYDGLCYLK